MKKAIAILMAALALVTAAGCKSPTERGREENSSSMSEIIDTETEEQEPLRVLMDVEFDTRVGGSLRDSLDSFQIEDQRGSMKTKKSFEKVIEELGGPEDMEIEFPPEHGEARDAYLTAVRTEIMAGKGPDVFMCLSGWGAHNVDDDLTSLCLEDALFKFPRQAMERNMFLPLDEYIENAQFMEWDKLTPVIMEAGKNEHGQLLLPMTYTVPLGIFKSGDVDFTLEGNTGLTWKEMLDMGPECTAVAVKSIWGSQQSAALAPLADYEQDELVITEEELLDYVNSCLEGQKRLENEKLPESQIKVLKPDSFFDNEYGSSNELTIIPRFSRGGGYHAIITSFTGINVNTKRPEDAFFLVDYIMGREGQQSSLFVHMSHDKAVPTMEGLLSGRGSGVFAPTIPGNEKYVNMSKNLYKEFEKLRDGISGADFYTSLDKELFSLTTDFSDGTDKTVEELVHGVYTRMNMMLAES